MARKNIKSILQKINFEDLTAEEENLTKLWIHQLNPKRPSGYKDEDLERVSEEMWSALKNRIQTDRKASRLWPRVVAIAAVLTVVLGIYFLNNKHNLSTANNFATTHDIQPGKSGATLTLASGKRIVLNNITNGELFNDSSLVITKSSTGQLIYATKDGSSRQNASNTLSTDKGQTYELHLPDRSIVWLNAASSLTYSTNLQKGSNRLVKLEGEAYFEVSKDKTRPFIVETKNQKVEVLGTHFNINAYPNEKTIKTTLIEGSIKINDHVLLKPDEQAINSLSGIKVLKVDAGIYSSWKDGIFLFQNEPLNSVLSKISRWYNIDIQMQDDSDNSVTFSGSISRATLLSGVIKLLEQNTDYHFKIENKKLIVTH